MVTALPTTASTDELYSYGRGNRRVYDAHWQWDGTTTYYLFSQKVYFYSVTGQKLGTYQLGLNDPPPGQGTPSLTVAQLETRVWFGSKLVIANGNPVALDRLGSLGRYYPYGEDRTPPAIPNDQEKFATYTRDSATGLDYAVNRYYYNVSGRFMSADRLVASGRPADPASWNRYAYTRGDPVNRTDSKGLLEDCDPGDQECVEQMCPVGYYYDDWTGLCEPTNSPGTCVDGYHFSPAAGGCEPDSAADDDDASQLPDCTIDFEYRGIAVSSSRSTAAVNLNPGHGYVHVTTSTGLDYVVEGYTDDSGLLKAWSDPHGLPADNKGSDASAGHVSGDFVCD